MPMGNPTGHPLNTFIVRFWQGQGAEGFYWYGQVQHVQSGESLAFIDEQALLSFIRRWVHIPEERDTVKEQGGKGMTEPEANGKGTAEQSYQRSEEEERC